MLDMPGFESIVRFHFALLSLILFNWAVNKAFGFGINNNLALLIKLILYISGIFLFFVCLKPFKVVALYFSFFVMTPTVITIFYFAHGIFLAILSSFFIAPIMPLEADYSDNNIKVYSQFNGVLGRCCDYYVTQNVFYVFEEYIGDTPTVGHIDFQNAKIWLEGDSIRIEPDTAYRLRLK